MKVIIDRFEGTYAVCEKENREMINISKCTLPTNAKEGDVLSIDKDIITIDIAETELRKIETEKISKDLWEV